MSQFRKHRFGALLGCSFGLMSPLSNSSHADVWVAVVPRRKLKHGLLQCLPKFEAETIVHKFWSSLFQIPQLKASFFKSKIAFFWSISPLFLNLPYQSGCPWRQDTVARHLTHPGTFICNWSFSDKTSYDDDLAHALQQIHQNMYKQIGLWPTTNWHVNLYSPWFRRVMVISNIATILWNLSFLHFANDAHPPRNHMWQWFFAANQRTPNPHMKVWPTSTPKFCSAGGCHVIGFWWAAVAVVAKSSTTLMPRRNANPHQQCNENWS